MPKVKELSKPSVSRALLPKTDTAGLSTDQLKRLYYQTTTSTAFVPKSLPTNASFSDVHKAAQHMGKYKPSIAPFWSREMSRYRQAYISLPLDGAVINRELASTFRPEATVSDSLPLAGHSRYSEDYGTLSSIDCRGVSCRPKQRKHVKVDDHLIYTDSISHETFSDLSQVSKRRPSCRPVTFRGVALKFNGASRYSEEFVNVSNSAYRIDPVCVSDESNRVQGNSIPNKWRDYMYNSDIKNVSDIPFSVEQIMDNPLKIVSRKETVQNPYIDEYLTYHRRS